MQVILTATKGPESGMIIAIRRGQMVRVGRTAWADFSVPGDETMSDVHFAIQCDAQGCRVSDLSSAAGTYVNGAKVTDSPLRTGDQVAAGGTVFSVQVEGQPAAEPATHEADALSPEPAGSPTAPQPAAPSTAADLCQHIELAEDSLALLGKQQPPQEFLETLIGAERFLDAVKFLAIWLPKPTAVTWAGQCLRDVFGESLPAKEETALKAALQWASEPGEENRRAAGVAAEAAGYDHAAGLLGLAAFVSGGSLAPADLAPVRPAEGLTARSVSGALTLAAYHGQPAQAGSRLRKFVEAGKKLAAGGPS